MRIAMLITGLLALPSVSLAHHSRGEFSGEMWEMEGELLEIDWSNPHPVFTLQIIDEGDVEKVWNIQGYGSLYTLTRAGVTGENFAVGDHVRLFGQSSTRRDNLFLVSNVLTADGLEVVFNRNRGPVWTQTAIGGEVNYEAAGAELVNAAAENRGIFRLWSRPDQVTQSRFTPPLTEQAAALRDAWDPLDDTSMRCVPKGMPQAMGTPHPYEFVDDGDAITILGHEFNIVRTIYMNNAGDPADQPPSHLGYSVGHWEGDSLVVETSRINWPYFGGRGAPQSEAVEVLERFTLSEDQSRFYYHTTVTDPATFTAPSTVEGYWVALNETVEPYTCKVDE